MPTNTEFKIKLNFPEDLHERGIIGTPPAYLNETQIPITGDGIVFDELRKEDNSHPMFAVKARLFVANGGHYEKAELILVIPEYPDGVEVKMIRNPK
ncbi:MAG: hypothetical protein CXR30_00010 [Geobacter sp.]|nr:MAG: hypothetical protein CXR30_00010 [Geobacter sp.]